MGEVTDTVVHPKSPIHTSTTRMPIYKVYFRSGMYLLSLKSSVSVGVEDEIASVTGPLFAETLQNRDKTYDNLVLYKIRRAVGAKLLQMVKDGMWIDDEDQVWRLRGESPYWMPTDVDDSFNNTRWYEIRKKKLQEKYGLREGLFLVNRIAAIHRKNSDPCKDNERMALESDPRQMAIYKDRRSHGCCGFSDSKLEFYCYNTGEKKVFWYGFNYGH